MEVVAEIRITRRALFDLKKIEEDSVTDFGQIVADKYMDAIEGCSTNPL